MIYIAFAESLDFYGWNRQTRIDIAIPIVMRMIFERDPYPPINYGEIPLFVLLNLGDKYISRSDLDDPFKMSFPYIFYGDPSDETGWLDFVELKIFNLQDLGIVRSEGVNEKQIAGYILDKMNLTELKDLIKEGNAFTIGSYFSELACHILNELENVSIYRESFLLSSKGLPRSTGFHWLRENDVPTYLQFVNDFRKYSCYTTSDFNVPHRFVDCFNNKKVLVEEIEFNPNEQFCIDFLSVVSGSIRNVIFVSSNEYIMKYLLADIERKQGTFTQQDAVGGNIDVSLKSNRIFIKHAHKLSSIDSNKIMLIANSEMYGVKTILMQSPVPLEKFRDSNFRVIILPSEEQINDKLPVIIRYIFEECFSDSDDMDSEFFSNFQLPIANNSMWFKIFKKIPNIFAIENEILELKYKSNFYDFDFSKIVFLWEFKNYIDKKYRDNNSLELIQQNDDLKVNADDKNLTGDEKPFSPDKIFIFKHIGNYWIISNPQLEGGVYKDEYSLLTLKYLAFLVKHHKCNYGKGEKISYKKLYNFIAKTKKTKLTSNDPSANVIDTLVRQFFNIGSLQNKPTPNNKRIQLGKLILGYFHLKDNCYYDPKDEIKIEVVDDDMRDIK